MCFLINGLKKYLGIIFMWQRYLFLLGHPRLVEKKNTFFAIFYSMRYLEKYTLLVS